VKVSLYTITLNGGYYDGPHVPLLDIFPMAKEWGYDGIEIEGKRPHGFALDLNKEARETIKKTAGDNGLEVSCIASYNDFTSPIDEHRENELLNVHSQIMLAKDVGAPIVRVFPFWSGVTRVNGRIRYDVARHKQLHRHPGTMPLEQWRFVRACLKEAAQIAEGEGIILALQNHKEIINTYHDMLDLIHEVDSPALKACLDQPIMADHGEEYYRGALEATGDLQVHTHFGGRFEEGDDGKVYRPKKDEYGFPRSYKPDTHDYLFVKLMKEIINYQGHTGYELCGPVLTNHDYEGLEYAKGQAALAVRFMRQCMEAAGY
jgi:sugar phosphate isomerase/epimerase